MIKICWLNGEFLPESEARVSVFDRGFLFGDGVYEVTSILDGRFIDAGRHIARMERSLAAIEMESPLSAGEWFHVMSETAARSAVQDGFVYMQVTRGPAERDFAFPARIMPTTLVWARAKDFRNDPLAMGVKMHSVPDLRWVRRDIKSVAMLAQVLAKQEARAAGAHEALLHHDGEVTEGSSSTVWIVNDGQLLTRPLSNTVLAGITREAIREIAELRGIPVVERVFTVEETLAADEVFFTSATNFVLPVVSVDGHDIADGAPGALTRMLRDAYFERAARSADSAGTLDA